MGSRPFPSLTLITDVYTLTKGISKLLCETEIVSDSLVKWSENILQDKIDTEIVQTRSILLSTSA